MTKLPSKHNAKFLATALISLFCIVACSSSGSTPPSAGSSTPSSQTVQSAETAGSGFTQWTNSSWCYDNLGEAAKLVQAPEGTRFLRIDQIALDASIAGSYVGAQVDCVFWFENTTTTEGYSIDMYVGPGNHNWNRPERQLYSKAHDATVAVEVLGNNPIEAQCIDAVMNALRAAHLG